MLTGILDFAEPGFGLTLRVIEEGNDTPPIEINPTLNEEASLRYFDAAYNAVDRSVGRGADIVLIDFSPRLYSQFLVTQDPFTGAFETFAPGYNAFLKPGVYNVRITSGPPVPVFYETDFNFEVAKSYTIYALPTISRSVVKGMIIEDDRTFKRGKARLRFVNGCLDSEPIVIKLKDQEAPFINAQAFGEYSEYIEVDALEAASGAQITYALEFRKASNNRNLFPVDPRSGVGGSFAYNFASGDVLTIVLTGNANPEDGVPISFNILSQLKNDIL